MKSNFALAAQIAGIIVALFSVIVFFGEVPIPSAATLVCIPMKFIGCGQFIGILGFLIGATMILGTV